MHVNETIYTLICIKNYVLECSFSMLSVPPLFLKSTLFICIFSFNHVIPLEIISFYFLQPPHTLHPKDRNPFTISHFIRGRRVEGNSNTLSSLHFLGKE